jgi:hypothetical protein
MAGGALRSIDRLTVNVAGRLAITPSTEPARDSRLDIRLAGVAPRETLTTLGLALGVVLLGLVPATLGHLSESTTALLAGLPSLVVASSGAGGLG